MPYTNGGNGNRNEEISPMELEALASHGESGKKGPRAGGSSPSFDKVLLLVKLYFELYPRVMLSGSAFCVGLLLWAWSPWQNWHSGSYNYRNHMTRDYTALQDDFNFKTAKIDHWCLFGGDDRCYCEDPTESTSRSEVPGWAKAVLHNKQLVERAMEKERIDVVFFGDQNIQAWDGRWMDRPAPEGHKIAKLFNDTFDSDMSTFKGVALGVYGDRVSQQCSAKLFILFIYGDAITCCFCSTYNLIFPLFHFLF